MYIYRERCIGILLVTIGERAHGDACHDEDESGLNEEQKRAPFTERGSR